MTFREWWPTSEAYRQGCHQEDGESIWHAAQADMREKAAQLLATERTVYPEDIRNLTIA